MLLNCGVGEDKTDSSEIGIQDAGQDRRNVCERRTWAVELRSWGLKQDIPTKGNPQPGRLYRSGEIGLSKTIVDNFASISNGGESGIRTRGRVWPLRRFSKPFLSATQASLRAYLKLYSIIRFLQPEIPVFFHFFQFRTPFFIPFMPFLDNRFDFFPRNSILLEDRIVGNRSV